jgi:hypothetical protein
MKVSRPLGVYCLFALMLFQAISAMIPGFMLVAFPSGKAVGLPLVQLEHSPFRDFLVPGLYLFFVLGVLPAVTLFGLLLRPAWHYFELLNYYREQHWSWTYSYYTGILLILWIDAEVIFIRSVSILHLVYSLLGLAIIITVNLSPVKKYYQTNLK